MSEPVANVANLDPAETVHEGGGAPTGQPPKPETVTFKGLDGEEVTIEKPRRAPSRPRAPKAEAKPAEPAAAAPPAEEPVTVAAAEPEAKPPADDIPVPPELAQFRRRGESAPDFFARYSREQHARALKAEERNSAILAEMAEMKKMLIPVYRAQWAAAKEEEERRKEEALAAVPDREADPEAYRTALAEETLRRQLEWERKGEAEKAAALEERRQQEEIGRHLDSIAERDESIAQERQAAIADPVVGRAAEAELDLIREDWSSIFPHATEAQLEELTLGTHMQNLIELRDTGIPIAQYYKTKAAAFQRAAGWLTAQPEAPAAASPPAGNGKPPAATGSPTGAAVAKEAAQARAAQALSGGGTPGRAGGIPGQVVNPLDFDSDWEYVAYMQQQPKGTSDRLVRAAIAQGGSRGAR